MPKLGYIIFLEGYSTISVLEAIYGEESKKVWFELWMMYHG